MRIPQLKGFALLGKSMKGVGYPRKILDKSAIEVGESEDGLHLFYISWSWPVQNRTDFDRIHLQSVLSDDKTKELHLWRVEDALCMFRIQLRGAEPIQDLPNMLSMVIICPRVHKDIVEIDDYKHVEYVQERVKLDRIILLDQLEDYEYPSVLVGTHPFSCACDGRLTVSTVLPLSPA